METMPLHGAPSGTSPDADAGESTEPQYLTFGQHLARAREAKGLSLDDVAHLTKIRRSIIEALEHNAKRELPEKVFVLGYVRSYATAVGLDVEEAVRRCSAAWDEDTVLEIASMVQIRKTRSWSWLWPTLAALAGIGAIWFIIHLR